MPRNLICGLGFTFGIPLGEFGSRCNLHYADDLLTVTMGGLENLRVIKLILYVFEGTYGLETNFTKTCLFSSSLGELPTPSAAATLSYLVGLLPVTYLRILISGRRPRWQDWEWLLAKVRSRLSL